jgi:hypothetical protein
LIVTCSQPTAVAGNDGPPPAEAEVVEVVAEGSTTLPAVRTPVVVMLAAVSNPAELIEAAVRESEPPVIAPVPTLIAVAETVPPEEVILPDAVIAPAVMLRLPLDMVIPPVVERPPVIAKVPLVG